MGVKKNKNSRKGLSTRGKLVLAMIVVAGIVFLPTSTILFIGMLPTLSIVVVGNTRSKVRVSTVAALNMVGCMPFIIKLWSGENNFEAALTILTTPLTIVIVYGAAASAYLLDWAVTGVVSAFMYQKAERRIRAIEKRMEAIAEVWGNEVADSPKINKETAAE